MAAKLKGLSRNVPFCEGAFIILKFKYNFVLRKIRLFLNTETVENLHALRIAIRRLRYSLENFEICYPPKIFQRTIGCLRFLQDLIGETRDLDILKEKVRTIALKKNITIPDDFYLNIDIIKTASSHDVKLELMKFVQDKKIRYFFTKEVRKK